MSSYSVWRFGADRNPHRKLNCLDYSLVNIVILIIIITIYVFFPHVHLRKAQNEVSLQLTSIYVISHSKQFRIMFKTSWRIEGESVQSNVLSVLCIILVISGIKFCWYKLLNQEQWRHDCKLDHCIGSNFFLIASGTIRSSAWATTPKIKTTPLPRP